VTRGIPFAALPDDDWRSRAADVIPGGSSTGSRRPDVLYGSRAFDAAVPTHYERADGCYLWSPDGRRFIDCGMALGAVGIGYADPAITRAVIDAASRGNVSALPHRLEVEVAERLVQVIPSAEQVRFLRTGAEANAAAIRMARALTGREYIVACGYFGWLDWCSDAAGVPASAQVSHALAKASIRKVLTISSRIHVATRRCSRMSRSSGRAPERAVVAARMVA
jgi:glutamate-1-semialdehyde aminotransferase